MQCGSYLGLLRELVVYCDVLGLLVAENTAQWLAEAQFVWVLDILLLASLVACIADLVLNALLSWITNGVLVRSP
jgi:hypothetical protein